MTAVSASTIHLSDYLYSRVPDLYGGSQADYHKCSEEIIDRAVICMREGKSEALDPTEIFFDIIKNMWRQRHEIAAKHRTHQADDFGVLRTDGSSRHAAETLSSFCLTGLSHPYEAYNHICLNQLHTLLIGLKHDLRTFTDNKKTVSETVRGRKCTFEVEVLDREKMIEKKLDKPVTEEELHAVVGGTKTFIEIMNDLDLIGSLKKLDKALYHRTILTHAIMDLTCTYPSPKLVDGVMVGNTAYLKSLYVLGTLRLEIIPGKSYTLSRYLTWMYRDYTTDPVDRMREQSKVMIIHEDPFLIKDTLKAISEMFKEAFSYDVSKGSVNELKELIALVRFVYAHCMPCKRGDGAVGDWLELALYRYHGFLKTRFNSERLPCFEPLASLSLSRYLTEYHHTIIVE